MKDVQIIGIAGGTASGKTTFAEELFQALGKERASVIALDSYYICNADKTPEERAKLNYDHPDAFAFNELVRDLGMLLKGSSVHIPRYDFSIHARKKELTLVDPRPIIIVEGILALHPNELRSCYSYKIFVNTLDKLRFDRRLERDVRERGRTPESVKTQWDATVHPMHVEFCEPSKQYADFIVSGEKNFEREIENLLAIVTK